MQKINRFLDQLTKALLWIAGPVLAAVTVIVLVSIIKRALFGSPIKGTTEIVQFGVMLSIALGVARATFIECHTRVTMLTDAFPSGLKSAVDALVRLISLGVFGVLFYMLILEIGKAAQKARVTEVFGIPYTIIYGALVFCIGITLLVLLYQLARAAAGLFGKARGGEEHDK